MSVSKSDAKLRVCPLNYVNMRGKAGLRRTKGVSEDAGTEGYHHPWCKRERFFYTMFSKRMDKYTGMFILKLNLLELKSQ